jgi:hypothetical protein
MRAGEEAGHDDDDANTSRRGGQTRPLSHNSLPAFPALPAPYEPTLNPTVAIVLSHINAIVPPVSLMSRNSQVS